MDRELSLEKEYLERTKQLAQEQVQELKELSEKVKADILVQKQAVREEAQHSISSNLWSSDNFDQLVELSQFASQTSDTITTYENHMKRIEQLEKLLRRPYFARVDFKFDDDGTVEKVYIGRYPLMDEPNFERIVYDWRAPISSLFYRYGIGRAFYEAPAGNITGEVRLKRQYEINEGELEYCFDADMQILDDFLRKMLAQNASPQMKSIVETIQRDQDQIIRNMACDLMMVQGVAGSGKTSVALHRVAYLMYQGLSNRLAGQDIIIISPNTLFEKYISHVLPELGEENVTSFLFDELYDMILERSFQTKNELYESMLLSHEQDHGLMKDSLSYKMSTEFIAGLSKLELQPNMTVDELIPVYRQIFSDQASFEPFTQGRDAPEHLEAIRGFTKDNLNARKLWYEDASALAYLYLKLNGYEEYRHIKHVVVDEAQDYYPMHFEILKLMFPKAQFTVLGDINQTIEKQEKLFFYDDVKGVLGKKNAALVTMDKSFRCSHEILEFSARFVDTTIQNYSRHGVVPQIIQREHAADFDALLKEIACCKESGYNSVGILCKSEKESLKLYEMLGSKIDVNVIQSQSNADITGTFILPIYLSKGLEFDAAIIWDVDNLHYHTPEDRKLLYIASTRALHRLNLFYFGKVSPLCITG